MVTESEGSSEPAMVSPSVPPCRTNSTVYSMEYSTGYSFGKSAEYSTELVGYWPSRGYSMLRDQLLVQLERRAPHAPQPVPGGGT